MDRLIGSIFGGKLFAELLPDGVSAESVEAVVDRLIRERTEGLEAVEPPMLINISGLPASGKTTVAKQLLEANNNLLYVSFDELMEALPSYQQDHVQNKKTAFNRWEIPAAYIGYRLLLAGVEKRFSILFEHSNAILQHLELYKYIGLQGYSVEIRYIDATPDLLVKRLVKRERFFPEDKLYQRWKALQELIPQYKQVAKFITLDPWKE